MGHDQCSRYQRLYAETTQTAEETALVNCQSRQVSRRRRGTLTSLACWCAWTLFFLKTARLQRGVTRKVRSLEKGGGLPHNSPPHKTKLRGLLGVHTLWRVWVGKNLRTQLSYSRNVLIRGATSTHSPSHSVSYTHDVFLRPSSGAHAHLHEAFDLLVTPFILNSNTE